MAYEHNRGDFPTPGSFAMAEPDKTRPLYGIIDRRKTGTSFSQTRNVEVGRGKFFGPFYSSEETAVIECNSRRQQVINKMISQGATIEGATHRAEQIQIVSGLKVGDVVPVKSARNQRLGVIEITVKNVRWDPEHYALYEHTGALLDAAGSPVYPSA